MQLMCIQPNVLAKLAESSKGVDRGGLAAMSKVRVSCLTGVPIFSVCLWDFVSSDVCQHLC